MYHEVKAGSGAIKLTSLDLARNNLDRLDAASWQALITSIENNFHLREIKTTLSDNVPEKLIAILNRNCRLHEASEFTVNVLKNLPTASDETNLSALSEAMTKLSQALTLLQEKTTPEAITYKEQLQKQLTEVMWEKSSLQRKTERATGEAQEAIAPKSDLSKKLR